MSSRRGKRAQKAVEAQDLPGSALESDTPIHGVDQLAADLALWSNTQDAPGESREGAHELAAAHSPTRSTPATPSVIRSLSPYSLQCLLVALLGACSLLATYTAQLKTTVINHQALIEQANNTLQHHQHSVVKLAALEKQIAALQQRVAKWEDPSVRRPATVPPDLLAIITNETQAACASSHKQCLASASQQLQAAQHNLMQHLHSQLSAIQSQQVDASDILPALVRGHSPVASDPTQRLPSKILAMLSRAMRLDFFPIHPQASQHLQAWAALPVPTRCLPLRGAQGRVLFQLPPGSLITSVSIHQPWNRTRSHTTAPHQFQLWRTAPASQGRLLLGSWTYAVPGPELQTFALQRPAAASKVSFELMSNHGSKDYTCLYSILFHGTMTHALQ